MKKLAITVIVFAITSNVFAGIYSGGTGSEASPYQISDVNDINELSTSPSDWLAGNYFLMTNDIDLDPVLPGRVVYSTAVISRDISGTIGFQGTKFGGTFNGNGYVISNLTINTSAVDNDFLGLFGYTDNGGVIKNLGIEGCNIVGGTNSDKAGALVGHNHYAVIDGCYATGTLTDGDHLGGLVGYGNHGTIRDCYANVTVSGDDWLGGLIGYLYYGSVSKSYSSGSVIGDQHIGGLAGYLYYGSADNSYSTGPVMGSNNIGGLAGFSYHGDVDDCYASGGVGGSTNVGGLLGDENIGTIDNSFWDGDIGGPDNGIGISKTTTEMQNQSTFTAVGWNFLGDAGSGPEYIWVIDDGNDYPLHTMVGRGSELNPFLIRSLADLDEFRADELYWAEDVYARLETSLDLTGITYTTAVIAPDLNDVTSQFQGTEYRGNFDGNGHVISNLTIDTLGEGSDYLGLFGYFYRGAVIKDLGIENYSITGGDYSSYIGGLVGWNRIGKISNTYATGNIHYGYRELGGLLGRNESGTIDTCHSTASVTGWGYSSNLGGLVGYSSGGSINNSYATGFVTGGDDSDYLGGLVGGNGLYSDINNCSATGSVTGGENSSSLGGLVGLNDSFCNITNSHATGSVTSGVNPFTGSMRTGGLVGANGSFSDIKNCSATGIVTGMIYVGGLCGVSSNQCEISGCYTSGSVNGRSRVGGLLGYNGDCEVSNSYSTAEVNGSGPSPDRVGGLIGDDYLGVVSNCYAAGSLFGVTNVGGLTGLQTSGTTTNCFWNSEIGGPDNGIATGKTTAEMKTQSTFTDAGWDFVSEQNNGQEDIWRMCVDGVDYPEIWWESTTGDFTCPDGVNLIDYAVLADTWNLSTGEVGYNDKCDLEYDDFIDFADLGVFLNHWLTDIE